MSSEFDWSQFQDVSPRESLPSKSEIDWDQFESSEEKKGIHFPKIGFGKQERVGESRVPEMKRNLARHGKAIGTTIAGMPGDVAAGTAQGLNWLKGKIPGATPKTEEEMKEITENPFTSQSITQKAEELFPSLAPRDEGEKEEEDAISLITSLVTPLPTGKLKAIDPRQSGAIYKAGKALGLTEKELTPLIQGTAKEDLLGKISKKTKGLKSAIEATGEKLSSVYEDIAEKASKLPDYNHKITDKLMDSLGDIRDKLSKTLKPSSGKQSAIDFINDAIKQSNNFGSSPEKLFNFFFDINDAIPWNSIKNGKKLLAAAKKPIMDTLESTYPQIAKDLKNANLLKSKLHNFRKAVGLPKIAEALDHNKTSKFLTKLVLGATTLGGAHMVGAATAGKSLLAIEGIRRVSTKLLTDPKWQNIHNKILTAIKNGSFSSLNKLMQVVKNKTKQDMPEDYEEIDWEG